ncbi:MAG: LruC domain-containing protein [Prevotellaceae bacterium]|nr:LruC domain-containing protein [Prevotellaceae bacterium]
MKDIDPAQDWKMTKQIQVEVGVYEDLLTNYTVNIYDNDPADSTIVADKAVHLLASGTANSNMKFTADITCPNVLDTLYVARIDPVGRIVYKPMPIQYGLASASFGSGAATRATTRIITITTIERPYTDAQIEDMLDDAEEYVSGTQMDADIIAGKGETKVYKITKSTPFTVHITNKYPQGTIRLIIAHGANAQHEAKETIPSGVEIIIAAGATLNVAGGSEENPSMAFTGTSRLVVLGGENPGHITGNGWIEFDNPGIVNYNGGVIDGFDGFNNKGGTFYNAGTITAKNIYDTAPDTESLFINHSCLEATSSLGKNASNAPIIENSCKLIAGSIGGSGKANGSLYTAGLTMGDDASLHCGDITVYNSLKMGNHSIIRIDGALTFSSCNVRGETTGEYAMLQLTKSNSISLYNSKITGNIYIETSKSNQFKQYISGNVTFTKPGNAPVISDDTDCTFANYPTTSPEVTEPTPPAVYTYVYEDNFPLVGDYDFNDIVLDVSLDYTRNASNGITATNITVTLVAVGASKTLGAGLRIAGVPRSQLGSYTVGGTDVSRFTESLTGSLFDTSEETGNDFMTIPLFGNAHAVLGAPQGTITNTQTDGYTADPRTFTITIPQTVTTQLITQDNLDFFISYQYKGMQKRVEVHLYEFWKYGATAKGTVQQENLDLAGNNTWAVCVPDFSYPKEFVNICDQKNLNNCAYSKFLNWARNRSMDKDWSMHPNKGNTYR